MVELLTIRVDRSIGCSVEVMVVTAMAELVILLDACVVAMLAAGLMMSRGPLFSLKKIGPLLTEQLIIIMD